MIEKNVKLVKNVFLRMVYTVFLAFMVTLFWGLGVSAFYPSPKMATAPVVTQTGKDPAKYTVEEQKANEDFYKQQETYNKDMTLYNRNVSALILGLSVLTLVVSLALVSFVPLMSDGLMLGSLFTLVYSIGRGLASEDTKFRFVIVVVGLLVTLFLGWWKFIKEKK